MKKVEAVAVIIEKDGRLLITKRINPSPMGHSWEFPGGKIEKGETVEECAVRECEEEIGVKVRPIRRLEALWYEFPNLKVYLHYVSCGLVSGEPRPIECSEIRWIIPEELSKFDFPPSDIGVIERMKKG